MRLEERGTDAGAAGNTVVAHVLACCRDAVAARVVAAREGDLPAHEIAVRVAVHRAGERRERRQAEEAEAAQPRGAPLGGRVGRGRVRDLKVGRDKAWSDARGRNGRRRRSSNAGGTHERFHGRHCFLDELGREGGEQGWARRETCGLNGMKK